MTTAYVINFGASTVRAFIDCSSANSVATDEEDVIVSEATLAMSSGTGSQMVGLYNSLCAEDKKVKKFENKTEGARRLFKLIEETIVKKTAIGADTRRTYDDHAGENAEKKQAKGMAKLVEQKVADAAVSTKAAPALSEAPAAPAAPAPSTDAPKGKKGRPAKYTGKLYPIGRALNDNPRREGSFGYHSLEIIRNKPGISMAEFKAAGGRAKDLEWDVQHGNAKVEN